MRTSEKSGSCFVRTDQLDGETDWKLRLAVPATQKLENDSLLFDMKASLYVEKPQKDIHSFIGTFNRVSKFKYHSLKKIDNISKILIKYYLFTTWILSAKIFFFRVY